MRNKKVIEAAEAEAKYEVPEAELSLLQTIAKEKEELEKTLLTVDEAIMQLTQELNYKVGTLRGREAEIKESLARLERLAALAPAETQIEKPSASPVPANGKK